MNDSASRRRAGISACARCLALLLITGTAAYASPQPPLAPATSTGTYTVTPRGCNDTVFGMACLALWLEERVEPDGSYRSTSGQYVDKPPGTYSYRSVDYYCDQNFYQCMTRYSEPVTVLVALEVPSIDPLESQLSYRFETRIGNVVGSSAADILLQRVGGGEAGNGVVDAIILEQSSNQTFSPVVPTSAQLGSSAWVTADLEIELEDVNVDGFVDVMLGNIGALIPGAKSQIVYSPGLLLSSTPKGIRPVDASLTEFTANLLDYIVDEDYFTDNAPLVTQTTQYWLYYCPSYSYYGDYGAFGMCYWFPYYTQTTAPDYSGFSSAAVDIWGYEAAVADGSLTRSEAVERIKEVVEETLDSAIGGWDMGGIFPYPRSTEDIDTQKGLEAFLAVLGVANANAQEVDTEEAPSQVDREPDLVYIVGRYVFGEGTNKLHTALYYEIPTVGAASWISAFDSNDAALIDGTLVGKTNDPRDNPLLMRFTLGTVTPPSFASAYSYFFGDLMSAHGHYRALPFDEMAPYDAIPELPPCSWCSGRNSNGYVNGIIQATHGAPNIERRSIYYDLSKIVGWEYPVEPHYFGL